MMANLSERDRKALRFGGIGVGIVAFLMLVGFPVMDYWDGLSKKVTTTQKELTAIQTSVEDAASASGTLKRLQEKATIHADAAGLNRQTAVMRAQIERLPGYRALEVQRVEDLPVREEENVFRSAVQLQFSGTLGDLQQVLEGMEDAKPALKVDTLSLQTQSKNPSRIDGTMVVSAYAVVQERTKG
jgi:hypothetical protein